MKNCSLVLFLYLFALLYYFGLRQWPGRMRKAPVYSCSIWNNMIAFARGSNAMPSRLNWRSLRSLVHGSCWLHYLQMGFFVQLLVLHQRHCITMETQRRLQHVWSQVKGGNTLQPGGPVGAGLLGGRCYGACVWPWLWPWASHVNIHKGLHFSPQLQLSSELPWRFHFRPKITENLILLVTLTAQLA